MSGDAELVLVGGKIFTASKERPWAKALAVRGDRILAVGTDTQVERSSGRRTKTVDLRGRVVVPGFIDAHAHMVDAALEFGWAHLDGTASMGVAIERMKALAARTPPGGWVVGVDWDEAKWPERRYFLRGDLDQVSTDHPVVAVRPDWELVMRAQAIMNRVFIAAVNRVGQEERIRFYGGSFVADPWGKVLKRASTSHPETVFADLDLSQIPEARSFFGFLDTRRPETYAALTRAPRAKPQHKGGAT